MTQDYNNLAIHTNQLTQEHLHSVRQALQWYSDKISHIHNIQLLHIRTRIPAHAMCISSAENIYRQEYYAANSHLSTWKDLLGLPQCSTWMHEGSAKLELKSLCRQHKIQYLITNIKTAKQLLSTGRFWHRHAFEVIEEFQDCALVSLFRCKQSNNCAEKSFQLAANY